jgi:very-short-patch-repair endonuclease
VIRGLVTAREVPRRCEVFTEPGLTRSEAERRLQRIIRAARLPRPVTNVRVAGWEVDAFWPRERLIVEVDGYAYHGNRAAFERDRRKDAALTAAGYTVIRITWRQLKDEPLAVVALVARLLRPG